MHSSLVLKTTQASFSPSLFSSNVFQKDCLSSLLTRCVLLLLWMPTSVNGPFIQVFQPSFFFNDTPKGWHGIIQYNVLQRCNILPWEVDNHMGHCSPWLYGKKPEGFKPSATVPAYFYNPQPHPRDSSKKLKEGLCPQGGAVSKLQCAN